VKIATSFVYWKFKTLRFKIFLHVSRLRTRIYFSLCGVKYKDFTSLGIPLLDVHPEGECKIGNGFVMVNTAKNATLGKNQKCKFVVRKRAKLIIGNKVGMSNTVIVATQSITLGNNLIIGGGVTIVDSDFHSLNYNHWHTVEDEKNMKSKPVIIQDNVFIGMNSIILKGVNIGTNSIIAAGSVVTTNIPQNQVWGGNPAGFIKFNK
jgi:acetyltransferase-like isoleucine patch superfamily enzyme